MNAAAQPQPVARESLVVLTHDEELLHTLRAVATGHDIFTVGAEADLATHLLNDHAGVAILDAAAVVSPIARLAERLKAQFPDLVLVVAGYAEDQSAVAAQVTNGTVYRFLHKPVSEQRVRLFVNAAWRRHGEEHAGIADSQTIPALTIPPKRPRRNWLIGGGAAALLAVVLLSWLLMRGDDTPSEVAAPVTDVVRAPAPTVPADPELERLLARADAALNRGALVEPAGESAADLYRQALQRSEGNERARAGLNQVVDRLLTAAETALLEQRTDDAERFTNAARAIQPDHVRVAFLTTQIGKERERALLTEARRAASAGNVEKAIAVLDSAAREGQRSTLVAEARNEFAQKQFDERVRDYLRRASERMRAGALVEPAQNNARFFIESARAIAPDDAGVRQAHRQLQDLIVAQARQAIAANDPDRATQWIEAARDAGISRDEAAALTRDVQQVRVAIRAEQMARLSQAFNQRIVQGLLIEPANDSAKYYLTQLAQTEADHPSTQLARQALGTRLIDEARALLSKQDFAGARRWLGEARQIGVEEARIAAVMRDVTAAEEAAARANEVVAATTLERVRYVDPEYPITARERRLSGWVDLEFTVQPDGSVTDLRVSGAEPAGIFEQSALSAVRRWRFKPVVRDGAPVEQRARLRIRFEMED